MEGEVQISNCQGLLRIEDNLEEKGENIGTERDIQSSNCQHDSAMEKELSQEEISRENEEIGSLDESSCSQEIMIPLCQEPLKVNVALEDQQEKQFDDKHNISGDTRDNQELEKEEEKRKQENCNGQMFEDQEQEGEYQKMLIEEEQIDQNYSQQDNQPQLALTSGSAECNNLMMVQEECKENNNINLQINGSKENEQANKTTIIEPTGQCLPENIAEKDKNAIQKLDIQEHQGIEDPQEEQSEKLISKEYGMENILKHVYNPLALEALHGDIFVDLNYDYANSQLFGQPSLMNQYKQLTSVENFEERGLVELNLQSHYTPVYDFSHLTDVLCDHQEPSLRELGDKLQKYQKVAQKMLEKGKIFKQQQEQQDASKSTTDVVMKQKEKNNNNNIDVVGAAMVESYKKFSKEARKFLSELKKRSKIFFYTLRQLNLQSFGYELKKYGYSSEFLQLLGYNVEQFKNLTVRKGMIELQNFKGRIALNKMSLDLLIGEIKDCVRIKTSYITSDNLELQVDGIVKQIFNTSHSSEIFPYFEFLSIIVLDVQTNTMKEIYSIRQANKQIIQNQQQQKTHRNQQQNNSHHKHIQQQQVNSQQSHSSSEGEEKNQNKSRKSKKYKDKKTHAAQDASENSQPFNNKDDRDILDIIEKRQKIEEKDNKNENNCLINENNNSQENQDKYEKDQINGTNEEGNRRTNQGESDKQHICQASENTNIRPEKTTTKYEKLINENQSVMEGLSQSGACQQSSGSVFGGPALPSILPNSEDLDVDEYYSMETQILLDKFYENQSSARRKVKRIKKNIVQTERNQVSSIISAHQDLFSGKTCGFRFLKPLSKYQDSQNNTKR